MAGLRYTAIRAAFEALALSQVTRLIRPLSPARGLIFTLHRVLPETPPAFAPNAILQVRPAFLEQVVLRVRELGLDIVHLDEAIRRIESDTPERRFVVFTFDDAYRDNLVHALPILRRHQVPFTLYVPTALVDGVGEVWWLALEEIVARHNSLAVTYMCETDYLPTATPAEKEAAYASLYRRLRAMSEPERVALIRQLADQYRLDLARHCRDLIMDWRELHILADDPLCTIGAHTVHHYELSKLPTAEARNEIGQSLSVLKAEFGRTPQHLSYPIGSRVAAGDREYGLARELGLRSGVTTRPGALYAGHRHSLFALPRISLNGLFQERRFIDVFATPDVFTLMPG